MKTKITNSGIYKTGGGGPMGAGDRTADHSVSLSTLNPYFSADTVSRWRLYVGMYETSWEARKIINIVPEDALRKQWITEGIPEEMIEKFEEKLSDLKFLNTLQRSLKLERLLGGCLTFLGLEDTEDDPSLVYDITRGELLRFINPIPISRISRTNWEHDPLSPNYMRPSEYLINAQQVHISRVLVWDGDPLFDPYDYALHNYRSNLAGFGPSKLAPIWDDIIKAAGTRDAAYQLIQTNNAIVMAISNLQDLAGTSSGKLAIEKAKEIANQISLYKAAVIDSEKMEMSNKSANFGSVPELLLTFIQILSAASDIPATRFLGQAPGGLNATGESDLENYYNVIDAYQRQKIEPNLRIVYDVMGYQMFPNEWKKERKNLEIIFPPLWNSSELEEAQKNTINIDNALKLFELGLISEARVLEELNAKKAFSVTLDGEDSAIASATGVESTTPEELKQEWDRLLNPSEGIAQEEIKNKVWNGFTQWEELIKKAGGNPETINMDQFKKGFQVEMEHTGTVQGNEITIAKIVLDHLKEFDDYYDRLKKVENKIELESLPEPTKAQKESGNYKKHHLKLKGFDIAIENPKGSIRKGVGKDGKEWKIKLPAHYGYIKKTKGNDWDQIDIYIGDFEESELVFIIDQKDEVTGAFDEHKCILGTLSKSQAEELYTKGFSDGKGKDRIMGITPIILSDFTEWILKGDKTIPFSDRG